MIGDLENDTALAQAKALLGADEVICELFDHGAELGMLARWGDVQHVEKVRVSGQGPHRTNAEHPDDPWTAYWTEPADFLRVASILKDWHDRRS